MSWSNLWVFMFSATLFFLGIDSAFSMVEATSTVITDLKFMRGVPRGFISFMICLFGLLCSIPFCTNWGFVLFDVIDHYLCVYLLFICGLFQCYGCGWGFDVEETMNKSDNHRKSLIYLTISYWVWIISTGIIFVSIGNIPAGILTLILGIFLGCLLPSFLISKLPFKQWWAQIALCGVRRIGYSMSKLSRKEPNTIQWWESIFVFYWAVLIKYYIPCVLWFLIWNNIITDLGRPYGGHAAHWQALGLLVPLLGLFAFLFNIFFCLHDEQLDMTQFKERFDPDFVEEWEANND